MKRVLTLLLAILFTGCSQASSLELQSYWSSKSEHAALHVIINQIKKSHYDVSLSLVKGAGGLNNYLLLQRQIIAQQLPDIVQLEGPTIKEWASLGLLYDLPSPSWFNGLPSSLKKDLLYNNKFVAIPIDLQRTNTLWINPVPFKKLNLAPPSTFNDLIHDLSALQKAGYIPLAFSKENWQETSLFENILLSTQGADFYRRVFVQQDTQAILSHKMTNVLLLLRHFYQFADNDYTNRSWPQSTQLFAQNKAAMIIGGDWVKGELQQQGLHPGNDFLCSPVPGTRKQFLYNVDNLAFIRKAPSTSLSEDQKKLIARFLSPTFQLNLNLSKGAIPARVDIPLTQFDACAQQEQHDFIYAEKHHAVLPSMANSMATSTQKKMIFFNVLHYFLQHPEQTPHQAQSQLNAAFLAIND